MTRPPRSEAAAKLAAGLAELEPLLDRLARIERRPRVRFMIGRVGRRALRRGRVTGY